MANIVNLDALIPREDLEVSGGQAEITKIDTLQIRDLEAASFFYIGLRKPDFQRETSSWHPRKIADLVETFLKGGIHPV